MTKQFVSIVHHPKLYNILDEINSLFSFELIDFENTNFFLKELEGSNANTLKSAIITKKNNNELLNSKLIDIRNIILLEDKVYKISVLLEKINVFLIKKKYNFQSQLNIKNYDLNLNSRTISNQNKNLKLTEREVDIILFLKEKNLPQSIDKLQNEVWGYSKFLETHTVETHIYRLRKKIKDKFDDDSFILTLSDGYKI
tara:strand:- start:1008 stop:1604 length:597 start_codon:yes stop_codon:yes gene_type:complete